MEKKYEIQRQSSSGVWLNPVTVRSYLRAKAYCADWIKCSPYAVAEIYTYDRFETQGRCLKRYRGSFYTRQK